MAGWQPQQAGVNQLCNLFLASQSGQNQAQILEQLEQYKQYPDFNNYLAYIFTASDQVPSEVRQLAGLYLKNTLRSTYATTDATLQENIKASLGPMLIHAEKALRHTAGSSITAIIVAAGFQHWPQLAGFLQQCLESGNAAAIDGGLDTLYKIIEESPFQMEVSVPVGDQPPVATSLMLVPPLLKLLRTGPKEAAKQVLAVLNLMARDMPVGIAEHLDTYLQSLFALANDEQSSVKQEVVKGMVQLLTIQPDKLQPYLYQVIEYMIQCNEAADEGIALESCEFWMAFCEARLDAELLRPFLPRLIPMLMKNMVFDEHDEEVQDAEKEEHKAPGAPERASEMKPVHHKGSHKHDGMADGDGDDDDEAVAHWNLRKCSAAGLDRLAVVYGDELLPVLMPIVEQRLQNTDWRARESAILALGAISEGCHMGLMPYLSSMVTMLLPKLLDTQPMVRIITCWTLGRYSYWLLAGAQETAASQQQIGGAPAAVPAGVPAGMQFQQVLQGMLRCVLDHNKYVQDAACSAVATLCQTAGQEEAADMLQPCMQEMVLVLSQAVKKYGKRNLHLACDALCMLGEAVGTQLANPAYVQQFMPAIWTRVSNLGPHDRELIPLLEAVITVISCLGEGTGNWAPGIFQTAMSIVTAQTALRLQTNGNATTPTRPSGKSKGAQHEYDTDLHALSLDVISALAEALGPTLEPVMAGSPLTQVILAACQDSNADIRQSGFALVGDMAKGCITQLVPIVPQLVQAALNSLAPQAIKEDTMRSCNNACWSLGQMAVILQPAQVQPWAAAVAERVANLLAAGRTHLPPSLLENSAITLGRVAAQAPDSLAPHLAHFCIPWCQVLRDVRDDVEKQQAFHGLFALIARNSDLVATPGQHFTALANAIVSWRTIQGERLQSELNQVLHSLHTRMTAAGTWQAALEQMDEAAAKKLCMLCGL